MIKNKNIKEEQMKDNEVETYKDVKEYLVAKGLYERVLNLWEEEEEYESFSDIFTWARTKEGVKYWTLINEELIDLDINKKIEPLVQDYKAKQGKEFIEYIETKPEEVVETKPLEKPKQYLCYVQGKALPKYIHKTLEQAKQEAQRLCRKELCEVMVLEVVSKYQAKVIVEEV